MIKKITISILLVSFLNAKEINIKEKIGEFKNLSEKKQLIAVNDFFNSNIQYTSDLKLYKKKNYIASLSETLKTMKGDCDDYVMAKYEVLKKLGHKNQKILYSKENNVPHVKLLVELDNTTYVLDNLNKKFRELSNKEKNKEGSFIFEAKLYSKMAEKRKLQENL